MDTQVLHWAAQLGDANLIAYLQEVGADSVPKPSPEDELKSVQPARSALGTAIKEMRRRHDPYGHMETSPYREPTYDVNAIYQLLERATLEHINVPLMQVQAGCSSDDVPSPLTGAVQMLDVELVTRLLAKGADPNFAPRADDDQDPDNRSHLMPLDEAVADYGFHDDEHLEPRVRKARATEPAQRLEIAQLLLAAGADATVQGLINEYKPSSLAIRQLLIEHGASAKQREPSNWSEDKSSVNVKYHLREEQWQELLSTVGVTKITVGKQDVSDCGLFNEPLDGHFDNIKSLDLAYAFAEGGSQPRSEVDFCADLAQLLPRLEELQCYSAEFITDKGLAELGRLALRVLELDGNCEGYEDSRWLHVSNQGIARLAKLCGGLKKLTIGRNHGFEKPGMISAYGSMNWENGASHEALNVCVLEGLAVHAPNLQSVCLNGWYDLRYCELTKQHREVMLSQTKSIALPAAWHSLQTLGLNMLVTDANLAGIFPQLPNLCSVALASPLITDAGLGEISACRHLQLCQVEAKDFGDAGVVQLVSGCKNLQHLILLGSRKITDNALEAAAAAAPRLRTLALQGSRSSNFGGIAALSALLAQCPELECLTLLGPRGVTFDAIEVLSRFAHLTRLHLYCEFNKDALPFVADCFATGFVALESLQLESPHKYRSSLLRASGIPCKRYSIGFDADMSGFCDMKLRIKALRPLLARNSRWRASEGPHLSETIKSQICVELLTAHAKKHGVSSLTCGYGSSSDEDETVEPVSSELRMCTKCHMDLPEVSYSKTQWKKTDGTRRCKPCVAT